MSILYFNNNILFNWPFVWIYSKFILYVSDFYLGA